MKVIDCIQGSEQWHLAKCGIPSASNFDKIITTDGKRSKSAEKYLYQLAGEKIIGKPEESYQNNDMLRGQEMEAEARQLYELTTEETVTQVGFCIDNGYGCSPDGLVGKDGLLEIKCPKLSTHVSYLLANKLPTEYYQQVQGQLLVTGRKWVDFVSYFPAIKPFIIRVVPDKEFQKALRVELELFCEELTEVVKKLEG